MNEHGGQVEKLTQVEEQRVRTTPGDATHNLHARKGRSTQNAASVRNRGKRIQHLHINFERRTANLNVKDISTIS